MENNHDIDKTFNEASKTLEEPATFPGFDKVWNTVEEKLDKKQDEKKNIPAWIPYGIAASLLIGSGIFYFKNENKNVPQSVIAQNVVHEQKDTSSDVPEHILKLDSMVKSNIRKDILPIAAEKVAYQKVPRLYMSPLSSPVYEITAAPASDAASVAEKNTMDTIKRQNLEEVITMGMRKERSSMVSTVASSAKIKESDLNKLADTAEVIYPNPVVNFTEKDKEPEILAYNKAHLNKHQYIASGSGLGNTLGKKADVNTIQGAVSGLNIHSGSGTPASGKAKISIRGTANAEAYPLIVINGMYSDSEFLKKLDPKIIESVQIFRGEKAVPVFGSRAINGVIVVITKDISRKDLKKLKKLLSNDLLTN